MTPLIPLALTYVTLTLIAGVRRYDRNACTQRWGATALRLTLILPASSLNSYSHSYSLYAGGVVVMHDPSPTRI